MSADLIYGIPAPNDDIFLSDLDLSLISCWDNNNN
jgi:hypothetical protein